MESCCDDQHRPGGAAGPAREDGPAVTVLPCLALTTDPRVRHGRTSPLSCKASCGQPVPKSVAATPPVIPCVRTAEPWIRRRRIPPSSCHSVHTGDRARTSSRTHLRPRARPLRAQTGSPQVRPQPLGTSIRQAVTTDGDIARGRVRVVPGGVIRRRRGQQSRPRTRHLSPAARKCHRTRRMSPAAAPCGASVASRATGAPTTPAPTSNHEFRAPTGARSGQVGEGTALPGTPESGRLSSPSLTDQG